MSLATKIDTRPYICGVYLSFESLLAPIANSEVYQNFFDSNVYNPDLHSVYSTLSKTSFAETSQRTRAGDVFEQKVNISLPIAAIDRSERITQILSARHIVFKLTNGNHIIIGRNDSRQNTSLKAQYNANEHTAIFQFTSKSHFPSGYIHLYSIGGIPFLIPSIT